MRRVEVPDWPVPLSASSRQMMVREGSTYRSRVKNQVAASAAALGRGDTPEEAELVGLARLSTLVDELVAESVAASRRDDALSWSQIGAALGITKQAAQQRFGVKAT